MSDIFGIGNDIIEISRIALSIKKHGSFFLNRLFTKKEQAYCNKHKNSEVQYAGRYAAKEAIAKALGLGFGKNLRWLDVEILNNENGKPEVILSDRVKQTIKAHRILLSISHCKHHATAVALNIH